MDLEVSSIIDAVDYKEYSNKKLLFVPLSVLAVALLVLAVWFVTTGSPVILGIEFVGGTELRVTPADDVSSPQQTLQNTFTTEPTSVQSVPSDNSYIVSFRGEGTDTGELTQQAEQAGFTVQSSSQISPSFGQGAQKTALLGMLIAFVAMSLVVFGLFRTAVPSLAVVASAFSDIIVPLAVMNLLGIELTLGTIAALLMLLGYSVDSDMLLNDYVVRRGGDFYEAVYSAMDTGLTMTTTSLVAMTVLAVGATILGIPLLQEIGIVIGLGLLVDVMNTYMMNVSLLRWYRFGAVES